MGLVPVGQTDVDLKVNGETVREGVTVGQQHSELDITNEATHEVNISIDGAADVTQSVTDDLNIHRTPSADIELVRPDGSTTTHTAPGPNATVDLYETTVREEVSHSMSVWSRHSRDWADETHTIGDGLEPFWTNTLYDVEITCYGTRVTVEGPNINIAFTGDDTGTYEYDKLEGGIGQMYVRKYGGGTANLEVTCEAQKETLGAEIK